MHVVVKGSQCGEGFPGPSPHLKHYAVAIDLSRAFLHVFSSSVVQAPAFTAARHSALAASRESTPAASSLQSRASSAPASAARSHELAQSVETASTGAGGAGT